MYLAVLHLTLDLDPEVTSSDRERVLRALRDKIRHEYGARITARTDEESAIAVAFFDNGYGRAKHRLEEILEHIESRSEARILVHESQIFQWFNGAFQLTKDNLNSFIEQDSDSQTIPYNQDEDSSENFSRPLIPSRFSKNRR